MEASQATSKIYKIILKVISEYCNHRNFNYITIYDYMNNTNNKRQQTWPTNKTAGQIRKR